MKKRIVSLSLVVALLAIAIVGTTMAYFTDQTEEKNNVFTVGKVDIELDEPKWNPDEGHLVPTRVIPKDPTITVEETSEDAYVVLEMKLNKYVEFLKLVGLNEGWAEAEVWDNWAKAFEDNSYQAILDKWFEGLDHEKWALLNLEDLTAELKKAAAGEETAESVTLKFAYKDVVPAGNSVTFFTAVKVPASVSSEMLDASGFNSELEAWNMSFVARAIQAEGFNTYEEACAALYH